MDIVAFLHFKPTKTSSNLQLLGHYTMHYVVFGALELVPNKPLKKARRPAAMFATLQVLLHPSSWSSYVFVRPPSLRCFIAHTYGCRVLASTPDVPSSLCSMQSPLRVALTRYFFCLFSLDHDRPRSDRHYLGLVCPILLKLLLLLFSLLLILCILSSCDGCRMLSYDVDDVLRLIRSLIDG